MIAPMIHTLSRCLQGCAVLAVALSLVACGRVVAGSSQPMSADGERAPVPVAQLLIEPDRFPPQYPAAVLEDAAVHRAIQDIDGVRAGAVTTPATCMVTALSNSESAGVEGVDSATASRLIVVVRRPAPPLRARLDQLRACPSFNTGTGEDASTVNVTVLPAPPVDADDAYAVEQTVTTPQSKRRVMTFAAQIGDTRVSASWLQDPAAGEADTSALDAVFRDAVMKLRRDG